MTLRKRRAEAGVGSTGEGAFPIDKSSAGFCGSMFGKRFDYGGERVELTSNPFGYFIFVRVVEGPNTGMLHSLDLRYSGDRLNPLED